jgi:SnoaL-like domain
VRSYFHEAFKTTSAGHFDAREMFATDHRCVVLWEFEFDRNDPTRGHVAGADVFRIRDGKVAEKLSYIRAARLDEVARPSRGV